MGFKKAILVLLLLIFLTMGAASAADTNTTSDNLAANEDTNLELSENDNILSVESNDIISGPGNGSYTPGNGSIVTGGTFSDLNTLIQNAENELILNDDYSYSYGDLDDITISKNGFTIDGNGHTINAMSKSRIFYITAENVVLKNIQFINGSNGVRGGAIHWNGENGTLSNCNFINNMATGTYSGGGGGAVYINSNCKVVNCNFTNNQVSDSYEGGAIYFYNNGNVTNCNFVNNTGAVYFLMGNGNVTNCNFTNNTAKRYGGAIYFNREGNVTNCNFINNQAHDSYDGGAIRIGRNGIVTNCNFTNNTANFGGAIYIIMKGKVTNSNFIANSAKSHGGAIYIEGKSNVSNCNFTNNTASYYGGAIRFESDSNITNSNFIANSAKSRGGAIYIEGKINVSNCNFTNNTAKNYGGAVYFEVGTTGNITNCNFIKCSAENAKAIYANNNTIISSCNFETQGSESLSELIVGGIISNCTINGNKEKTEPHMTVTVEDITYGENATFTVTLPSDATGILNITVGNMAFTADVGNEPIITKFSGLDIGTYIANITYTGDLKYLPANANETFTVSTKGNKTFTDLKNLIDSASSGDTIELDDDYTNDGSITADGITISKPITIDGNGHTLNANGKSGLFKLNVDNIILNNIEFLNASHEAISVSGSNCKIINCNFNNCSPINSSSDYGIGGGVVSMNSGSIVNCSFINCVHDIQKTISGGVLSVRNSDVINCRFFNCTYGCDLVYGGAIYLSKSRIINCSFSYCGDACNIIYGGAINGEGSVINCTFSNCTIDSSYSAYVHFEGPSNLTNSIFIDCISAVCCNYGCVGNITNCTFEACSVNAIVFCCEGGNVTNCKFNDCTSTAIYVHDSYVNIVGCIFKNCSSDEGGAINIVERYDNVINCSFIDCSAERGGAIYAGDCNNTIINCSFINCSAQKGGSIYWNSKNGKILNSNFTHSQAENGGAIYVDKDIILTVSSSKFEYNTAEQVGSAIYFNVLGNVTNCTFNGNSNPEIYPNNRTSDTNSTFTELKDLIDSANSGDTIDLSGYYYGSGSSISIDKTVTLRGIGETVLDAKGLSSILSVSANNVRIENIKFVNGQNSGNWGGAIHWEGDSGVLINSTFVNNAASWGAGIFWWAQDGYMANCTFENNTAERYGGALYVNGENLRMLNSLFKNNIVTESISSWEGGGAIYTDGNNHLVANSTFIDNKAINSWGGAIKHGSETASYQSNEFYNNTAIRGNSVWESDANNLVNNIFNLNSIDEIASCVEDANLSALFENNIFKVKGIVISKDDYFNETDTGSNESSQNITQSTFTDITNLISNAHAGDTINLEGTYYGNGSIITVNKELTISGDGETILDAKNLSGILSISANNVKISNIRFINGKINANGGAINWIGKNGTISNCTFINCSAENGGSVYWNGENGMINKSTFDHSTATSNGGAIYWNANNGEIANSIFTNSYAQNGGAVYVPENRNVEIKSSIFDNNIAEEESGAVYGGTIDEDCTFKNNTYTPLNTTTIISINETAVYAGNDISITTIVLSQKGGLVNTGTVEIYINSKLMATIPANTAYIYKTGDVGTYQVLAKFIDDSSYKDSSSTAEFTVIPVDIPEEIETSTAGIFTLEFPDDAEGTLTVFIDGTKYKVYDIIGGILKIDLSDKKGKYNITFEYSGDKNYPAFKKDANITVETNPSITASNAKVLYSAGTTYKITVYKNKGITANSVNVVIKQNNKKFKTIKTNSKGIASFKITQTPGTYKLKITSLGKTVTKTLTVKHIVTLKTATVKKSAKKLILQATLAKVNKKYLKKKTVTFKFNGKKYKTKTNAKGVAKVTIKSNILKKLKVGKKITYQATYLKDTVKKTAKVKK
ncbi:MAG: hypothetical protein E7Z79_07105 [Methanobrevibacter thaueri]|uniref:Right handed beta helix domain-containing protein n=1 Tax=Methanobrevibacter thaueri TaxID=190975 RepID=A0A8T3VFP4_9EURY|nr:hypothetical protein [Methanobrevibacter thaueri]MBE6502195.1 hypothetical protein [Methanobrevibacter thaueri]